MKDMMFNYGPDDAIDMIDFPELDETPRMEVEATPLPSVEAILPVIEDEAPEPATEPALVLEPRTHRVVSEIGEVRTVMRLNGLAGIRALRPHHVADDSATVVYLRDDEVALVFDHQDEQWDAVSRVLATSPKRVEATGRVQPVPSVPFDVPGVESCMLNPGTVRFYEVNNIGMADGQVDMVVENGQLVQQPHAEPTASTVRRERDERRNPKPRRTPHMNVTDHGPEVSTNSKKANIGQRGSTMRKIGNAIRNAAMTIFTKLVGQRAHPWEARVIQDTRNMIELAGEIVAERGRMESQNAPRLDIVELDRALGYLQHRIVSLVADLAGHEGHPLREQALAQIVEITDMVADGQNLRSYPRQLRSDLGPLTYLSVRASAYAETAEISRIDNELEASETVDRLVDICVAAPAEPDRQMTNQVGLNQ